MEPNENRERALYHPDDDRELSTAILETIEALKNEDLTKAHFQLYDDIDPDALEKLFRKDATANTSVEFTTDDVEVTLRGNGAVAIDVTPRETET